MSRTIRPVGRFQRDYKRVKAGVYGKALEAMLGEALALLATDKSLPPRFRDHPLTGPWQDCRDCHLRPDLVLIYRKPDEETLELLRLGSHSELFS
jgi:mRNA interferase YafQ